MTPTNDQELIQRLLDDELTSQERSEIQTRLESSDELRAMRARFAAARKLYQSAFPEVEPDLDPRLVVAKAIDRVGSESGSQSRLAAFRLLLSRLFGPVPLASAAAGLLAGILAASYWPGSERAEPFADSNLLVLARGSSIANEAVADLPVAGPHYTSAVAHRKAGRYREGVIDAAKALAILSATRAPEDPLVLHVQRTLAELYFLSGERDRALEMFLDAWRLERSKSE